MPYIPSESEVSSQGGDFKPLPEDDYLVTLKSYELKKDQPNPYNKTEQYPAGVPRDVLNVKMTVLSFSNGDELYDVDGEPIAPGREVLLFDFLDTSKTGMKPRPSKYRTFVASVFGKQVGESVTFDSWDDLMDKRFIASAIVKNHPEKGPRNSITGYKVARRRPGARPAAAAPVATPAEVSAAAAEVFGDDFAADLPF